VYLWSSSIYVCNTVNIHTFTQVVLRRPQKLLAVFVSNISASDVPLPSINSRRPLTRNCALFSTPFTVFLNIRFSKPIVPVLWNRYFRERQETQLCKQNISFKLQSSNNRLWNFVSVDSRTQWNTGKRIKQLTPRREWKIVVHYFTFRRACPLKMFLTAL